jgi:hypothetical protein
MKQYLIVQPCKTPGIYSIYCINVKLPNLDLKLGIQYKAGNFLSGKRGGRGPGGERDRDR